jgi:hypothetical protein
MKVVPMKRIVFLILLSPFALNAFDNELITGNYNCADASQTILQRFLNDACAHTEEGMPPINHSPDYFFVDQEDEIASDDDSSVGDEKDKIPLINRVTRRPKHFREKFYGNKDDLISFFKDEFGNKYFNEVEGSEYYKCQQTGQRFHRDDMVARNNSDPISIEKTNNNVLQSLE